MSSGSPNNVEAQAAGGIAGGVGHGIDDTPRPVKTICGVRTKVFFVILAAAIIIVVAGLSAGLGAALSRSNNSAPVSTVTVTGGENTDLTGRTTSSRSRTTSTPLDGTSTSSDDTGSSTLTRNTASSISTDNTSNPTPPIGPELPEATRFPIEAGIWTITLSKYSTSGNLCTYFNVIHPTTTVVGMWMNEPIPQSYVATWGQGSWEVTFTGGATATVYGTQYTATATFEAQAVTDVPAWDFRTSIVPTVLDCEFEGTVDLLFEQTGRMRYIYSVNLRDQCSILGQSVAGGSSCSLYWRLVNAKVL